MDTIDTILRNFGQWCEVEGPAVASEITLVVFQIDGTERGRFRLRRNDAEPDVPLYISTSAETLEQLAAGEREPQLAFLDGSLRLAGSRVAALSASGIFQVLARAMDSNDSHH